MAKQMKNYEPFELVREHHPWKRFPLLDNKSEKLIIGSFPPNKFTSHIEKKTLCDMDFFYGSKENSFWELFVDAINLNLILPDNIDQLKKWLTENKWMVTDIINSTNRKKDTAYDSDLINIEWNIQILNGILNNNPIKKIYFTSQWVKNKFDSNIRPNLSIQYSNIDEYILLSPSRNGLRTAKVAKFTSQKPLENETAEQFRKRYYKTVLNN